MYSTVIVWCKILQFDFLLILYLNMLLHCFSIPAAKKVNMVYANDLNPESYKWLVHNSTKNKERTGPTHTFHIFLRLRFRGAVKYKDNLARCCSAGHFLNGPSSGPEDLAAVFGASQNVTLLSRQKSLTHTVIYFPSCKFSSTHFISNIGFFEFFLHFI